MTFKVSRAAQGRWMNLGNIAGDGMNVAIKFEPGIGMIVRKFIPAVVMEALDRDIRYQRDIYRKGTLIGNTQNHRLPIASLPTAIYNKWKDELGDWKKDESARKKWMQRFNSNEYRDFRLSEHKV